MWNTKGSLRYLKEKLHQNLNKTETTKVREDITAEEHSSIEENGMRLKNFEMRQLKF